MHARKTLIAALVVITAVLAPSALAQRDDRSGTAEPPISAAQQSSSTRPDDRAGWRGAYEPQHAAATSNGRPDDRAGIRGPEPLTCTARPSEACALSRYSKTVIRADLSLIGAGGEPVDFARTIVSHGVAELAPNCVDLAARTLETTLPVPRGARTVRITAADGMLRIETVKGSFHRDLSRTVAHMFRLDEDLSAFYAVVDDDLAWCASGAGRMLRAPTVFEDVVKTICTTNTAWSGTRKMTRALVEYLGVEAPGGQRAFPTAEAMAEAGEGFYRTVARAGYRGPYLKQLAT